MHHETAAKIIFRKSIYLIPNSCIFNDQIAAMSAHFPHNNANHLSLQEGGISAFETLYKQYWYPLYCIACKQTTSPQDAEELVQTLFEKIWKNRAGLEVKHWGAFLAASMRNLVIDFQRQQAVKARFLQNYNTTLQPHTQPDEMSREQLLRLIEDSLSELPEKTQTAFKLSRYENKSVREIAQSMQLTEKAVEYHITKSIKKLRHQLKDYVKFFSGLF